MTTDHESAQWAPTRTRVVPVAIVTGFLGSGKTTFIRGLLDEGGGARVAVIVNELGELGIDGALLEGAAQSVVELPGGCMCCESRGDVGAALAQLSRRAADLDAIVVETSGVSDPLGVADLLAHGAFPADLRLSQVVTVVDAENFDRNLADAEAAYVQVISADLFIVGKADLVEPEVVSAIGDRLSRLNPRAATLPSNAGRAALTLLGEVAGTTTVTTREGAAHTHPGFESVAWESRREIDFDGFLAWVEQLPPTYFRVKALVRHDGTAFEVHRVGARVTVLPTRRPISATQNRVVVIGRDIDAQSVRADLAAMQLSNQESA